ncbi:MAG: aminotransferase class I/II-fold pyridoxal phosphate-dependent enzyme, partial [Candidatus Aminicenantaceae bacterium]
MVLKKKGLEGKRISCDDYTLVDFLEFESNDLFEVADYFWEYMLDAARRKYLVYGQPMMSGPKAEFKVYDRNTNSVRKFLNFCSYNYLGYSFHPEVVKAVQATINEFGTGAVSAPLLSGYSNPVKKLEEELAKLKGKESAIVFSTGYVTNLGILSALLKPGDTAVLDI